MKYRHEPGHEATIHYNTYRNIFNITKKKSELTTATYYTSQEMTFKKIGEF